MMLWPGRSGRVKPQLSNFWFWPWQLWPQLMCQNVQGWSQHRIVLYVNDLQTCHHKMKQEHQFMVNLVVRTHLQFRMILPPDTTQMFWTQINHSHVLGLYFGLAASKTNKLCFRVKKVPLPPWMHGTLVGLWFFFQYIYTGYQIQQGCIFFIFFVLLMKISREM